MKHPMISEQSTEVEAQEGEIIPATTGGEKKPYRAPRLVHLGSVRALTWGGSGTIVEDEDVNNRP